MDSIRIKAPAKINLTLDITGRLKNGYHTIESLFHSVSLFDTITLTKTNSPSITITCDKPHIPLDSNNLCHKAAILFFEQHNISGSGLHIDIQKNIPSEAGMGGGSADAAATLKGLYKLYNIENTDSILELGLRLGADVPFCILNRPSFVTGIGEKMTEVAPLPDCHIVIVKPDFGSSTKEAYSKYDLVDTVAVYDSKAVCDAVEKSDLKGISENLYNIFEALLDIDEIYEIKTEFIKYGALGSSMSGSGTAVFGIYDDSGNAEKAAEYFRGMYSQVYVCRPYCDR